MKPCPRYSRKACLTHSLALAIILGIGVLSGCGDSSATAPPPDGPEPAIVTVSPDRVSLEVMGGTVQFTATVRDQVGREMSDVPVTWYTSDETVATVSTEGLATAVGDGDVTILAAASASAFGWAEMAVKSNPIKVVNIVFPAGVVGLPYSRTLEAEGVATASWSISAGSLPDGLSLDGSTGEISGTPVTPGTSTFTVLLTGPEHTATREFFIVVLSDEFGVDFEADQFALIPAGEFQMGSENGYTDERPVHTVRITQPFLIQKTEVTQYQWETVMGSNPSAFATCGQLCPVERVPWELAQDFIQALNVLDPGKNYRLPTEAEWEYAARAGTTGDFGGNGVIGDMGWTVDNSGGKTHFVAQKLANDWGLYDMHGNVREWVQDWYSATYYAESPQDDPTGPDTGTFKVYRSGSADASSLQARSAARRWGYAVTAYSATGLRLVRDPE